jgi:DNA-binding HxlR family transcriptional regulator
MRADADASRLVAAATVPASLPGPAETSTGRPLLSGCRSREILHRVGDKWSAFVIDRLGQGSMRFSELRRGIDGITGRMLTVTLRGLERDGLVSRTIHPVIPPRVDYELTAMGRTLLQTIEQLIDWADSHVADIHAAQAAYDARHAQDTADAPSAGDPEITACEAAEAAHDTDNSGWEAADGA